MVEAVFLVPLLVLAILALESRVLRMAVIYLGIFSLLVSFLYLYYNAPDVAIAEAVMASGLTTLIFLTALKRYRVYSICFTNEEFREVNDRYIIEGTRRGALLREIEEFCIRRELEPQVVCTPDPLETVLSSRAYDLVIRQEPAELRIHGSADSFFIDELEVLLILHYRDLNVRFVRSDDAASAPTPPSEGVSA